MPAGLAGLKENSVTYPVIGQDLSHSPADLKAIARARKAYPLAPEHGPAYGEMFNLLDLDTLYAASETLYGHHDATILREVLTQVLRQLAPHWTLKKATP